MISTGSESLLLNFVENCIEKKLNTFSDNIKEEFETLHFAKIMLNRSVMSYYVPLKKKNY